MKLARLALGLVVLGPLFGISTANAVALAGNAFSYTEGDGPENRLRNAKDFLPPSPMWGLPRKFLFSGGYMVDLTVTEMRIDHMAIGSNCPRRNRDCLLAVSFSQPVGQGLFSSRFDFPLVSAEGLGGNWAQASLGDYVVYLSNIPLYSPALRLLASARF
jgi:hypothetical protein